MKATKLINYDAARRALALVVRKDEAKAIRDKAVAMEVYAYQAKDGEIAETAVKIRRRATRRIGELMEDDRKAGLLAKGARERGTKRGTTRVVEKPASLAKQGIDKNLADQARKLAAMPEDRFEAETAQAVEIAVAAALGNKEVVRAARTERHRKRTKQRAKRERELSAKIAQLPDKTYGVILADPEWKWKGWSPRGMASSSAANHYPTSDLEAIKARPVQKIAAADCVLFLWCTAPMMPQALAVMEAWGFAYKTQACWDKVVAGTGYWFRNQHELLLVGTRGKIPAPADGTQWPSIIVEKRTKHSVKPQKAYELIERYFPSLPKVELNARKRRKGWDSWGTLEHEEAA